jgi:hypothetical protein
LIFFFVVWHLYGLFDCDYTLKVEFEATKCWLKSSNSNKVIVEVVQKGSFYKLVGIAQSLVAKCIPRLRGVTCGIRYLDMLLQK